MTNFNSGCKYKASIALQLQFTIALQLAGHVVGHETEQHTHIGARHQETHWTTVMSIAWVVTLVACLLNACKQPTAYVHLKATKPLQTAVAHAHKHGNKNKLKGRNDRSCKITWALRKLTARYIMFTMLAVMVHNINVIECPPDGRLSFAKTSGQRIINKLHKWVTGSWGAPQWELKQKRWCNVGAAETAGAGGGGRNTLPGENKSEQSTQRDNKGWP